MILRRVVLLGGCAPLPAVRQARASCVPQDLPSLQGSHPRGSKCGSELAREEAGRSTEYLSLPASPRDLQIIHHPIHRQLAEHDQLRDPQQRPALRRGDEMGEVMGDGSG